MEYFTGHLRLPFPSPCGAAGGPRPPPCAIPGPLPLVGGCGAFLEVKGVSQDMQMCIGLDPTQHLTLSITSISAARGHGGEEDEAVTGTVRGRAPGG